MAFLWREVWRAPRLSPTQLHCCSNSLRLALAVDQHRQAEIAEPAFFFRHVGFEDVLVVEQRVQPFTLDDQGIEWRKDMHAFDGLGNVGQRLGCNPVCRLGNVYARRQQQAAPHA
jgi:hypothetical protein